MLVLIPRVVTALELGHRGEWPDSRSQIYKGVSSSAENVANNILGEKKGNPAPLEQTLSKTLACIDGKAQHVLGKINKMRSILSHTPGNA